MSSITHCCWTTPLPPPPPHHHKNAVNTGLSTFKCSYDIWRFSRVLSLLLLLLFFVAMRYVCLFKPLCVYLFSQRNTLSKDSLQLVVADDRHRFVRDSTRKTFQLFRRNGITAVMWVRIPLGAKCQAEWRGRRGVKGRGQQQRVKQEWRKKRSTDLPPTHTHTHPCELQTGPLLKE